MVPEVDMNDQVSNLNDDALDPAIVDYERCRRRVCVALQLARCDAQIDQLASSLARAVSLSSGQPGLVRQNWIRALSNDRRSLWP